MTKDDLLALPAAVAGFNGFYSRSGQFLMMNQMRLLIVYAVVAIAVLIALVVLIVRWWRRRKRSRA